ncbi:MAG: aldehyde dehydrogenase family protein [Pyrinomonadaceae bacterium MAG19_C2-C3]|nr:aldehyde dehydrogenase family protein [Pyrinomonadaceae bacterium MAG19_C2-C3]
MDAKPFLIGGEWRTAWATLDVRTAWNDAMLARVCIASPDNVRESIEHAMRAAREMRALARYEIADALGKIVAGLKARHAELARTIAQEAGKPIALARAETERAIATFTFASEEARKFTGEQIAMDAQASGAHRTGWTKRIPRGVIFGITPFNFPLNLVAHKVAPALASGNSIIIKPSPRTPLSSLLLGKIFLESGLPKGSLQIVPMEIATIDSVLKDERVAMVSFTGSAAVGWDLRARSGRKAVTLELGGNAPIIIDETADAEYALERTAAAAFGYAGQTCISAQRLFVHESIYEDFKGKLVNYAQGMKAGDPLDETTTLPAMIDEAAARRVEAWIEEATRDGARVLCGGERRGAVMDATLLENVHREMRVVAEEVFSPVATITSFHNFDEAIAHANDERYGLQAGVFTGDLRRAFQAADELEFGGVIINDAPTFRVDNMPYGGVKQSGFGREGVRYAMEEMTETRVVVVDPMR